MVPPQPDSTTLDDVSDVVDLVTRAVWPETERPDLIGLEIEAFPVITRDGRPAGRLPLHGPGGVISAVEELSRRDDHIAAQREDPPVFATSSGGRITFEPGAQIEHSSGPQAVTGTLQEEVDASWDALHEAFGSRGVNLVPLGLDPWHSVGEVPQQQRAARYVAMDGYFSRRWPAGAEMMRNSCSIQVNLDAGTGAIREERWLAANLVSPVLTAMFASSPGAGAVSMRARVWQDIDPTRTGFPDWRSATDANPVVDAVSRALDANVMFVIRGGTAVAMSPGLTLYQWAGQGHPRWGHPTVGDVRNHLSTIFTEVRPRGGTLEMRGIDAMPRRWWVVPAVITASLLYDDDARGQAIEMLGHHAGSLRILWREASDGGLAGPGLRGVGAKLGQLSLDAARRHGRFDPKALAATEQFLDRFTLRGLSPGDELSSLLADRGDSLRWALAPGDEEAIDG